MIEKISNGKLTYIYIYIEVLYITRLTIKQENILHKIDDKGLRNTNF